MSGQLSLEKFFTKSKSCAKAPQSSSKCSITSERRARKRSGSAKSFPIPMKSPKVNEVINLISDDEGDGNIEEPEDVVKVVSQSPRSDASDDTIVYSIESVETENDTSLNTPLKLTLGMSATNTTVTTETKQTGNNTSTQTPSPEVSKTDNITSLRTSPSNIITNSPHCSATPLKSTPSPQQSLKSHTPTSATKFYSPTKKRMVFKRTENVKRDLKMQMNAEQLYRTSKVDSVIEPGTTTGNDAFSEASEGMDDKTIFLLTIIKKCLNDQSLCNLMDPESQKLLSNCLHVVKPGMRLVSKLYWRKEGWYKKEEVNLICGEDRKEKKPLDEVTFETMIESLEKAKLILKGDKSNMTFEDFAKILNREDCIQICKNLKLIASSKKEAIEALQKFCKRKSNISSYFTGHTSDNSRRVLKMMSEKAGSSYKLTDLARRTLYKLYILMYLGMDYTIIREKRLEYLLLYDKIKRETYPVDKNMVLDNASVVFHTREDFERYVTAHDIYEDFLMETDVTAKCATVKHVYNLYTNISEEEMTRFKNLPIWLRRFTSAYKYVRILEAGIQELKKDKDGGHNLLALNILKTLVSQSWFRHHKKAEWYAEWALILHSILNRCDEAAEVLAEGFNNTEITEETKACMRPRARKIALQKNKPIAANLKEMLLRFADNENVLESQLAGLHIYKQPMDRSEKRGKLKFETRTSEVRIMQDAEEYCIGHYISSGEFTDGEHWEGRIATTIFFLLFWDIVYTPPAGVRGVFLSPYQLYPLDLFSESFYANRKAAIDQRLDFIENATEEVLKDIMLETWNKRPESELSGIVRNVGWEKVRMVAKCLGPKGLAVICRRLAHNYHYAHSGFPDLTLWNRHSKRIKFVEVKTDTDKPSTKQKQWMLYLRENGIETEFCYVGVNTTRQRSRGAEKSPRKSNSLKRTKDSKGKGTPKKKKKADKQIPVKVEVKEELSDNDFENNDAKSHNVKKEVSEPIASTSKEALYVKAEPQDEENINTQRAEFSTTEVSDSIRVKEEPPDIVSPQKTKDDANQVQENYENKSFIIKIESSKEIDTRSNENKILEEQDQVHETTNNNNNIVGTESVKSNKIWEEVNNKLKKQLSNLKTSERLVFEMSDEETENEVFSTKKFRVRERLKENININNGSESHEKFVDKVNTNHSIHSDDTLVLTPRKLTDSEDTVHSVDCDCGETLHL